MLRKSFLAILSIVGIGSVLAETPRNIAANSVTLIVEHGKVYASGAAEPSRGDSNEGTRNSFKPIAGLKNIKEVDNCADASDNAVAVDEAGRVWVWGKDWHETVGSAENKPHVPFQHPHLKDIASIAMGEEHLVALEKSGSVVTVPADASANEYGALGSGRFGYLAKNELRTVSRLAGISDAVAVEAGIDTTLVLRSDGSVWGCGSKVLLGQPTSLLNLDFNPASAGVASPTRIAALKNIRSISLGYNFGLALDKSGQVWGWGLNDSGQLGTAISDTQSTAPKKLRGLSGIVAVSAGRNFLLAITKSGSVVAQGGNVHGTLGDGGGELEGKLRTISQLKSVVQISAGHYNAFARTKDGMLLGWGSNDASVGGFAAAKDPVTIGVTKVDVKSKAPAPSSTLSSGGVKAIVTADHNDYYFKSEQLRVTIGESTELSFALNASKDEQQHVIEIPGGATPYGIRGTVVTDDGAKHEIKSAGVFAVSDSTFESYFEKLAEQKGLLPAIKQTLDTFLKSGLEAPFSFQTFDAWTEKELAEFETKTNVVLPASYKKVALEIGFFSLGHKESPHPLVSLLPPDVKRNLEHYAATAIANKDTVLPDGPFKEVCWGLQYMDVPLPKDRTGWKHLIVGTADESLYLLVDKGKGNSLSPTWTGLLERDDDNYTEGNPDAYYNWEERWTDKVDPGSYLTHAASNALATILRKHGVAPLVSTPSNEPVYIGIEWPGEDEPEAGETLEYLLQTDGW